MELEIINECDIVVQNVQVLEGDRLAKSLSL